MDLAREVVYDTPIAFRCKVKVSEPLDRPPPHSRCPRCVKTPYVVASLSLLPPCKDLRGLAGMKPLP